MGLKVETDQRAQLLEADAQRELAALQSQLAQAGEAGSGLDMKDGGLERLRPDDPAREAGYTHSIVVKANGVEDVAGVIRWPTLLLTLPEGSDGTGIVERVGIRYQYRLFSSGINMNATPFISSITSLDVVANLAVAEGRYFQSSRHVTLIPRPQPAA